MIFEDQKARFVRDGYAVFPGALAGRFLQLLCDGCDAFVAREEERMDAAGADRLGLSHRGRRYFANECQRERPALRQMLLSRTMADICRATLGDTAYFFFDQYAVKGPEGGLPFAWHQDSAYVVAHGGPADHLPYLTRWCPLDDVTAENGTVRVIPGSHKRGIIAHARQEGTGDLAAHVDAEGIHSATHVDAEGIAIEAAAGSVVAFSSLLLHATGANRSPRPRRVYLAQYTAEAMLDPGTRQLRRNAIPLLQHGRQVSFG